MKFKAGVRNYDGQKVRGHWWDRPNFNRFDHESMQSASDLAQQIGRKDFT